MLHILLMLLKIIGILLLAILGLLVLILCIVLFVPIRYEVSASAAGNVDSIKANVRFSWLLRLISGYVVFEEKKADWQVRILWKKLNIPKPEKEKLETVLEDAEEDIKEAIQDETPEIVEAENGKTDETAEPQIEQKTESEASENNEAQNKKQNIFEKIKYTIQTICDKIKLMKEKAEEIERLIKNEVHQAAVKRSFRELIRLLRFLKPKKLTLNAHFGFEDPATTGQVVAVISVLYPFIEKCVDIKPDFESQVLEGDVYVKGVIRGIYAVIVLVNIILDKNIRLTFKELQKWKR